MVSPVIPVIIVISILKFLDSIPKFGVWLSNFFLSILFIFTAARLNTDLGIFYSAMLSIIYAWTIFGAGEQDRSKATIFGRTIGGTLYNISMIIMGFLLYLIMRYLSVQQGGFIVGIPTLSTANTEVLTILNPALVGALGYIENRFFFVIFDVMNKYIFPALPFPILSAIPIVFPLLITSLGFGLFHSLFLNGFVIFAALVMALWILFFLLGFPEATNIAHYIWNATIQLAKVGVKII